MKMNVAPRGAIPNWQPATTIEDYLRNCREGLEEYSDRRAAKLFGWSRIRLHRARLMAKLPDELFDRLLDAGLRSSKALANVALALKRGELRHEVERCPHCSGVLRTRSPISEAARSAIRDWLQTARQAP